MKKILMVLLAMVFLAVNSYALDFQGLRLGMTREEVRKWIGTPNVGTEIWNLTKQAEQKLLSEGVTCHVYISGDIDSPGRVEKIEVHLDQGLIDSYKQALHEKYGKPTSSKITQWQNNFGVKLEGVSEWWDIKGEHIWFSIAPRSIDKYDTVIMFITNEQLKLESKKPEPKL